MERIDANFRTPQRNEIWYYHGNKTNIKGMLVKCIGDYNTRVNNINITGYNTQTKWDVRIWSCQGRFLRPYNQEPDWEV